MQGISTGTYMELFSICIILGSGVIWSLDHLTEVRPRRDPGVRFLCAVQFCVEFLQFVCADSVLGLCSMQSSYAETSLLLFLSSSFFLK